MSLGGDGGHKRRASQVGGTVGQSQGAGAADSAGCGGTQEALDSAARTRRCSVPGCIFLGCIYLTNVCSYHAHQMEVTGLFETS